MRTLGLNAATTARNSVRLARTPSWSAIVPLEIEGETYEEEEEEEEDVENSPNDELGTEAFNRLALLAVKFEKLE